jgi:hypothetical protein
MSCLRTLAALCVLVGAAGVLAPAAGAAGPPLPSSGSGRAGAVAPGGRERLLTRPAGRDTVVLAVRRGSAEVLRSRRIAGRWSVPAVTLDNATTGLSADGRTLVLARPTRAFPPTATRLAVVDARTLGVRRTIALRGFFTVDAISPDGRWAYVIQYPSKSLLDYRVRALDTVTGRLGAGDVVDPRAPGEQMGGLPMTRAVSRDGRWAYTLYSGEETFIHALDTVGRTAACIDLATVSPGADLSGVRLSTAADGRRIDVRDAGRLVASVDARTFAVSAPGLPAGARPAATRRPSPASSGGGGLPWLTLLLAGAGAASALAALLIARRRDHAVARAAR